MDNIKGYRLKAELSTKNAGFSLWGFCEKDGREYFIKEFIDPKYPLDDGELSEKQREKRRNNCEKFYREKKRFYDIIRHCRTGNIITVEDFFRFGSHYYIITDKVAQKGITPQQLAYLPDHKKFVLIRALLYSFSQLHEVGIVHSDIKPDNILIRNTASGYYTGKIIDFDSGFLKSEPPSPDDLQGDFPYRAPEAFLYSNGKNVKLNEKLDIFALGILFHQYWTGELPAIGKEDHYIFEAVLNENPMKISGIIPNPLRSLIINMLKKDPEERPSAVDALKLLSGSPQKSSSGGWYIPRDLD